VTRFGAAAFARAPVTHSWSVGTDAAEVARKSMSVPSAEFVPLQLEASGAASSATEIQIEVRRGAATVTVRWPLSAASDCAVWLQGWLR
jgi:transposase